MGSTAALAARAVVSVLASNKARKLETALLVLVINGVLAALGVKV